MSVVAEGSPDFTGKKSGFRAERKLWVACLLLVLALALQVLISNRRVYAQNAVMRPVVSAVCTVFRCTVPAWREIGAFKMQSHDVVAHPGRPDVLQIRGSFRNEAKLPQAWPVLRATLSDINGTPIYRGDFLAKDYLAGGQVPVEIGAGQTALIELNVRDPAQRAVSFDFAFRDAAMTPVVKSR